MYEIKKKGKRYVGIAQTGAGWNVSTWTIGKGNHAHTFKTTNTKTLANARKEFTKQKKKYL